MKKLILILIAIFLCVNAYAATVPTNATSDTVTFDNSQAVVITFNTATSYIELWNESKSVDGYVDFRCRDNTRKSGFATTNTAGLMKLTHDGGGNTQNTVKFDYSTRNLGIISDGATGTVNFRITGEQKF